MKKFGEFGFGDKSKRAPRIGDKRPSRRLHTETLEDRRLLAADVLGDLNEETAAQFSLVGPIASVEPAFASGSPSDLAYALGDSGQLTTVDTQYDLAKPNHSPVFFHDGDWWGVFRSEADGDWWLWQRDSNANWSQTSLRMGESGSDQPDVIVDSDANRMYTFFSHASSPDVFSATYNGSSWSVDPLVNGVEVPGMDGATDQSVIALASRWATPTLFAFRYADTEILANWSTDHGRTWQSSTTTIADGSQGMSKSRGLVDATEFSWNDGSGSANYVAVAYGENSQGQFGLITVREGDSLANENSWDHTVMPELAGGARSDDHISITRDGSETDNRLYIVGKTEGGGSESTGHALFVRSNDPTGAIALTNVDAGRSRPVAVFDSTNDELYLITTNASGGNVAYRKTSTPVIDFGPEEVFIENGGDDFINGGTSHTPVDSTSGLLYVSGNKSDDDIWENHFSLGPVIPVPGIVANPFSDLITSEDGLSAVFGVVLKAEPTAMVSVPISSSDESEGTVDKLILTFTPLNWNEPQFVTITGVDDGDEDGSVEYEIEIGAASGATEYLGIDAINPTVVNLDNDQTAPIASLYFAVNDEGTIGQGLEVGPEDIILDSGTGFSTYFDGSDVGLEGFSLGSFDILSPNEILLTFEDSGSIPGVGNVGSADIIKFTATQLGETTTGFFELYFNASAVGSDGREVDAMSVLSDGRLVFSFTGSFSLPGASGKDEDLVLFTPTSLGVATAGTWEFYFDGGDVGLSDGGAEDIDAVAVGPDGEIYFSTPGDFNVPGASGGDSDIVVFEPIALGTATSGDFLPLLAFEGEARGLNGLDIKGIDVPSVPPVPNDPPQASDDITTTDEDQSITIAVLAGDSDPNDDSLSVTELDTTLTVGSATINPDNTVDYTPPADFHGVDSFGYTISDGRGGIANAMVTVTINAVNDAPSFTLPSSPDQSLFVDAGPQSVAGFMNNASSGPVDEAGQLLQIQISTDNDSLFSTLPTINPNTGDLTYTIVTGLTGSAEVTVQLMDDGGTALGGEDTSAPQMFMITVNEAPLPPTAVDDFAETDEDQPVTIAVLAGDSDPNGDPLSVTELDTTLTVGSVTINPNSTVDYTPAANFHGVDTFEYTISDGLGGFASATVTVTINSVNDSPVVANPIGDVSVFEDAADTVLDVSATFGDVDIVTDADVLTISVFDNTNPALVTANLVGEELTLSYSPGQTGVATLTIRAADLSGAMVDATFQVSVNSLAGATDVIYFAVGDEGTLGTLEVNEDDVIAFDGVDFRMLFDGSDVGINGMKIDALDVISPNEILLSFAKGGSLPGVGSVRDEDVIKFTATELGENSSGVFEMFFDGSDVGLAKTDIDAFSLLDDGRLLLSASSSYSLPGASGKDEDIFAFMPTSLGDVTSGSFEVYFDGSDVDLANGGAEDTDGASVSASGVIYLSTPGNHSVTGVMGTDNDILVFTPSSVGSSTAGVYDTQHYFSGSVAGLGALDIKAFDVPNSLPALAHAFAAPSELVHVRSVEATAEIQTIVRATASLRSRAQRIQLSPTGELRANDQNQFVDRVFANATRFDSPQVRSGRLAQNASEKEFTLLAESRDEESESNANSFDAFFKELENNPDHGSA